MKIYSNGMTEMSEGESQAPVVSSCPFLEVFDMDSGSACVRFTNGQVGVIDEQGNVRLRLDKFPRIEFAGNDFIRVRNGIDFLMDIRSQQIFAYMPEVLHYGSIELLRIGGFIYTRTSPSYGFSESNGCISAGRDLFFVTLPCPDLSEQDPWVHRLITNPCRAVCLLAGDERTIYWHYKDLSDGSPVVMDGETRFYHATPELRGGKVCARKTFLGEVKQTADLIALDRSIEALDRDLAPSVQPEARGRKESSMRKCRQTQHNSAHKFHPEETPPA